MRFLRCAMGGGLLALLAWPVATHAQALRGKVIVEGEGPVPLVEVRLVADSAGWLIALPTSARTDSIGEFLLHAPRAGLYALEVRRVGINPVRTQLFRLSAGDTSELLVRTDRLPANLSGVTVKGETGPYVDFTRGFSERRQRLHGTFLDRNDIEKRGAQRAFDVLMGIPGLRVVEITDRGGSGEQRVVADRGGRSLNSVSCPVAMFVDGIEYDQLELHRTLGANDFEAVEFYTATETPSSFRTMNASCGTVLFWTRVTGVSRKKKP